MVSGRLLAAALIFMLALAGMGSALLVQHQPAVVEAVELHPRDGDARRPAVRLADGAGAGLRATEPAPPVTTIDKPVDAGRNDAGDDRTVTARPATQRSSDDDDAGETDEADGDD